MASSLPFKCANKHFSLVWWQSKKKNIEKRVQITLCFQFSCNVVSQSNCWMLSINIRFVPDKTFFFWGTGKTSKGSEELVLWDAWGAGMLPYLIAQQSDHFTWDAGDQYFPFLYAKETDSPTPYILYKTVLNVWDDTWEQREKEGQRSVSPADNVSLCMTT